MPMSKDKCPGCLQPNTGDTIEYGGRVWHKGCLQSLQANVLPPDKAMFRSLSKAFGKVIKRR